MDKLHLRELLKLRELSYLEFRQLCLVSYDFLACVKHGKRKRKGSNTKVGIRDKEGGRAHGS